MLVQIPPGKFIRGSLPHRLKKKVGRLPYKHGFAFSTSVKQAALDVIETRKKMRYTNVTQECSRRDKEKLELELKQRLHELKILQANADKQREEDLSLLAMKRAEEWDMKTSEAIIVIKNSEESKAVHKKQKHFLKPSMKGGIKSILVPAPRTNVIAHSRNITDESTQYEVEDPKEIFNILLRQNYRHLLKSEMSIFTR